MGTVDMKKILLCGLASLIVQPVFAQEKTDMTAEGVYTYDGIYDTVNLTYTDSGASFPIDLIDCSDENSLCYYSDYSGGIVVPRCGKSVVKGLKQNYMIDKLGTASLSFTGKNTPTSVYSFKYSLDNQDWYSILFYSPSKGLIAKANYDGDPSELLSKNGQSVRTDKLRMHYAKKTKGMFAC